MARHWGDSSPNFLHEACCFAFSLALFCGFPCSGLALTECGPIPSPPPTSLFLSHISLWRVALPSGSIPSRAPKVTSRGPSSILYSSFMPLAAQDRVPPTPPQRGKREAQRWPELCMAVKRIELALKSASPY